ncbi:hypothetical protein J6590_079349 [Homalodisca vitripennis]|nr:hypothetical protein J6590_079349 [Homalodisca vitripennis]
MRGRGSCLLVVSQNGRALHIVFPHQFLDSPEWFGVSTDEYFQVSVTAMEDSRVLLWHRDKLKLSIITDQFLQAVFDHILGRDVVKKLMQGVVIPLREISRSDTIFRFTNCHGLRHSCFPMRRSAISWLPKETPCLQVIPGKLGGTRPPLCLQLQSGLYLELLLFVRKLASSVV